MLRRISLLKNIKPKNDWVMLTRQRLLSQIATAQPEKRPVLRGAWEYVLAFARTISRPVVAIPVLSLLVGIGAFADATQSSIPGDSLYPIRSAIEKAQLTLSPDDQAALTHLELAQRRLADLKIAAEGNRVKNLYPTIQEFEGNMAAATKEFSSLIERKPERALQAGKELVELQKAKNRIEQTLGTVIGEEKSQEFLLAVQIVAESELGDLEKRSLNDDQKVLLEKAKRLYAGEQYQEAIEVIWEITNK